MIKVIMIKTLNPDPESDRYQNLTDWFMDYAPSLWKVSSKSV